MDFTQNFFPFSQILFSCSLLSNTQTFSPKDLSLHGKHLRTSTCFLSMKGYLRDNSLVIFCCIITLNLNTLKLYVVWFVIIQFSPEVGGKFLYVMDLIRNENTNVGAEGKQFSLPLAITLQHSVCLWYCLHQLSAPCMWKVLNILN